jgi:hypothetical protein
MPRPPARFSEDIGFGKRAEQVFLSAYSPWIEPANHEDLKAPDFRVRGTSDLGELKADRYRQPKNFFLEEFSSEESGKLGGPFRAEQEGVRYYAYWFTSEGVWFLFELKTLMKRLRSLDLEPFRKRVANRGYTTVGYAVPRELLEDIATKHELELRP